MFLLLFFLSFSSDVCQTQMIYSRMMPNDPRYVMHRPPPVRRSAMEALERLRMPPVARYFHQVDSPVASGPYQQPPANSLSGYPSADLIYALPPMWNEEFGQQLPERAEDDGDYDNYEYENVFAPVYRPSVFTDDTYGQAEPIAEPESPDNQLYNDFMVNYFLGGGEPVDAVGQPEQFDLQRRSELPIFNSNSYNNNNNNNNRGVITLSSVFEANKNATNPPSNVAVPVTLTPPAPVASEVPPQVQMTAVPSSPEKKEIKSLVIPEPAVQQPREEMWREVGQKEEPLFRPMQNSQKTTWDVLARAKNSVEKRPIPLLKKMIQSSQQQNVVDPLMEELKNLKKERNV